jgi:hypothetical protein
MGVAIAILLPPHAAVAGIIADSPYARLDEMIRMIITQILDQKLSRWHGPARAVRILIPTLTRLTFLGERKTCRSAARKVVAGVTMISDGNVAGEHT